MYVCLELMTKVFGFFHSASAEAFRLFLSCRVVLPCCRHSCTHFSVPIPLLYLQFSVLFSIAHSLARFLYYILYFPCISLSISYSPFSFLYQTLLTVMCLFLFTLFFSFSLLCTISPPRHIPLPTIVKYPNSE